MELLITLQTLRLDSAARITAVIPYLCYGRSDKKDQPRVPITGRLVADMIEVAGADRYMTLDPHAGQIQGFFSIPGDVLTASRLIIDEISTTLVPTLRDPVVVATDLGFAKKARNYAADLGMPVAFIEKRRTGNEARAEALSLIGDVAGSDVLIVDDEVDTGGSIMQAIKVVKENGALDVYLAFVHAVLSADAARAAGCVAHQAHHHDRFGAHVQREAERSWGIGLPSCPSAACSVKSSAGRMKAAASERCSTSK